MVQRWAAFASHGDPNYDLQHGDVEWPIWFDGRSMLDFTPGLGSSAHASTSTGASQPAPTRRAEKLRKKAERKQAKKLKRQLKKERQKQKRIRKRERRRGPIKDKHLVNGNTAQKVAPDGGGSNRRRSGVMTGPEYLEIGVPLAVRAVGRDCYCEFWDQLDYRF
eukprot:FR740975.1.p1 GENE.FR740975.1~~FR740975.1.p1  ORF type:complete len:175 (+),score=13.25 FR740975.1:36-527(+)